MGRSLIVWIRNLDRAGSLSLGRQKSKIGSPFHLVNARSSQVSNCRVWSDTRVKEKKGKKRKNEERRGTSKETVEREENIGEIAIYPTRVSVTNSIYPFRVSGTNWIELRYIPRWVRSRAGSGMRLLHGWKTTGEMYTGHVRESTRGYIIQAISMEWQGFYKVSIHRKILTSFLSGAGNLKTEYAGEPSILRFFFLFLSPFQKRTVTGHNFDCISAAHPRQCASFPFLSTSPSPSPRFSFFFPSFFFPLSREFHGRGTRHTTILCIVHDVRDTYVNAYNKVTNDTLLASRGRILLRLGSNSTRSATSTCGTTHVCHLCYHSDSFLHPRKWNR